MAAWGPPLPNAEPAQARGPPTEASASAAHQADVRSRRALQAAVARLGSAEGKAAAAQRLNAARRAMLLR